MPPGFDASRAEDDLLLSADFHTDHNAAVPSWLSDRFARSWPRVRFDRDTALAEDGTILAGAQAARRTSAFRCALSRASLIPTSRAGSPTTWTLPKVRGRSRGPIRPLRVRGTGSRNVIEHRHCRTCRAYGHQQAHIAPALPCRNRSRSERISPVGAHRGVPSACWSTHRFQWSALHRLSVMAIPAPTAKLSGNEPGSVRAHGEGGTHDRRIGSPLID